MFIRRGGKKKQKKNRRPTLVHDAHERCSAVSFYYFPPRRRFFGSLLAQMFSRCYNVVDAYRRHSFDTVGFTYTYFWPILKGVVLIIYFYYVFSLISLFYWYWKMCNKLQVSLQEFFVGKPEPSARRFTETNNCWEKNYN